MGGRRNRTGKSMNLVLWFTFSAFALLLILLFLAGQSLLVGRRYREQTGATLRAAGTEMSELFSDNTPSYAVKKNFDRIAAQYDVNARLLFTDGRDVFSLTETDGELAAALNRLALPAIYTSGSEIAYVSSVVFEGTSCFLYVYDSLERINDLERGLLWVSLFAGLFAVALAFVASGFVAMLIAKPVAEVTERAKRLAQGQFDVDVKKTYFCSEIAELSEALDYAREEISKADAMQKELIANVSHDFKTPLTMIKAYASMIREISGDDKEKRDYHAQVIIDEADRLAALVGDVLDLSKLRAGVGEQAPTAFDLSETVYKIMRRFDYLSDTQGYRFDLELEDELYVYANRERIEQVVYNLVGNAVNYTGEDKRVFVKAFRKGEYCRLEVSDTGRGIPAGELENIWDRYYRIGETHKRPVQGTGLGLSIVKGILQNQNCPFGAESEVGKGSMFWAEIPIPPEDRNGTKEEGA